MVEPAHLENMLKSNWIISPGWTKKVFETTTLILKKTSAFLEHKPTLTVTGVAITGVIVPPATQTGHYCWWLKSCTTWDVWNPINNGKNYLSTGAGFQPSTVLRTTFFRLTFWGFCFKWSFQGWSQVTSMFLWSKGERSWEKSPQTIPYP